MRVAVFRASDDGWRTAARLAERGHVAVLAPAMHIVPTGATLLPGAADALVFTSAHAPQALARHEAGIAHLCDLPCWCVGARTVIAARQAGFTRVTVGIGNAADLAAAILASERPTRIVLVAGRDRKPALEKALTQAGMALTVTEAYVAEAVATWPDDIVSELHSVTAALHYSRRSAVLAHRLCETTGLGDRFRAWSHHCLSEDVAEGLRGCGAMQALIAERPDETALLATLQT